MNDEKLIECVRKYPVLYDPSNPKYMDTEFKNTVWNYIGEEIQTTGPSCKTRWGNIRDNYRKSLKKSKTVSGQKAKTMKKYKYSQQLRFLIEFFEERKAMTNVDEEITNLQDFTDDDDVSEPVFHENEEEDAADNYTTAVIDNPAVTVKSRSRPPLPCPIPVKMTKQLVPNSPPLKTAAATIMEYLVKINESTGCSSQSSPSQDPVDAFLSGIAPTLKNLPLRYWHYAKNDIFAAVQKYELQQLMDQGQLVKEDL